MQTVPLKADHSELPDQGIDTLIALHRRSVDACEGYATMVEKAELSFRPVAERFRALHAGHADRLARLIAASGSEADTDGTFMGTVNKAVVSLRAIFDRIDADVMANIRSGEDHVLQAFDNALAASQPAATMGDLRAMRAELSDLLAEMRHLG
jgi:uncharacterized protein (TIGR02284 family)